MGRKSRLKKERKESRLQEQVGQLVSVKTQEFLKKNGVPEEDGDSLVYLISMLVNFSVYRTIKQAIQLPSVKPEHEEHDDSRIEGLRKELGDECQKLGLESNQVMDELVTPLGQDAGIIQQVLEGIYYLLETLIPTENFRKMTEDQIQDVEAWGDRLEGYEDRKEDYFETLKEVFTLNLGIVRSGLHGATNPLDLEVGLSDIRSQYGLQEDEFEKLVRRATEFLRVAFANYLEMDFQGVRLELHARSYGIKAEEEGL